MDASRGFSLTELLAGVGIAAVLASAAVPSIQGLLRSSRVSSAANDVMAGLLFTRSEAMKRRVRVVMCRSADGATCAPTGGWQQGWIVFEDKDGDGERDASERLLQAQAGLDTSLRMTGTSPVAKYVSYTPSGATKTVGGGFQAGTVTVCSRSRLAGTGRQIVINANGRPRTQRVNLPSCSEPA